MARWPSVVWTEAQQVFVLLGWPETLEDRDAPETVFDELRESGMFVEAVKFLAMALSRYEAVMWAAEIVRHDGDGHDPAVMHAVDAWLRDPSDEARRATYVAANRHTSPTPERMCAMAAFMSGGSISATDQPCRQPPRAATGRFAAMAVIGMASAAMSHSAGNMSPYAVIARRQAALDRALDVGLRFAEQEERETA